MARIGYFEGNEDWFEVVGEMAVDEGHEMVSSAHRWNEIVASIDELTEGDVEAVIVGSRLSGPYAGSGDGVEVTRKLHEKFSGVVVISLTGDPDGVQGADHNVLKHSTDPYPMDQLVSILGGLAQQAGHEV